MKNIEYSIAPITVLPAKAQPANRLQLYLAQMACCKCHILLGTTEVFSGPNEMIYSCFCDSGLCRLTTNTHECASTGTDGLGTIQAPSVANGCP